MQEKTREEIESEIKLNFLTKFKRYRFGAQAVLEEQLKTVKSPKRRQKILAKLESWQNLNTNLVESDNILLGEKKDEEQK